MFQMLGLLKLIRVARLSRVIKYMNLKSNLKMTLRLAKLILFLFLYLHIICCVWFYIVDMRNEWIPPIYDAGESSIYVRNHFHQYIVSLYYSVLLLAGNDNSPQTDFEITFVTVMLVAAAIINANIFGNIAVILQQLNRKQASFHEKIENAAGTMRNLSIPENLQNRVHGYLTSTQSTLDQQKEFDSFLSILSPSLKLEVTKHIFSKSILSNPIFEEKADVINILLHDLQTMLYYPEDEICRQGAIGMIFKSINITFRRPNVFPFKG